jgi:hypothetical protein
MLSPNYPVPSRAPDVVYGARLRSLSSLARATATLVKLHGPLHHDHMVGELRAIGLMSHEAEVVIAEAIRHYLVRRDPEDPDRLQMAPLGLGEPVATPALTIRVPAR